MLEMLLLTLKLMTVEDFQVQESVASVTFADGRQAVLPATHKQYDYYLKLIERSKERRAPVGVQFDASGQLQTVARVDNNVPVRLIDQPDENLKVIFFGHDGVYQLRHDHPDFAALKAALEQAVQRKQQVYYVAELPGLFIQYVQQIHSEVMPSADVK